MALGLHMAGSCTGATSLQFSTRSSQRHISALSMRTRTAQFTLKKRNRNNECHFSSAQLSLPVTRASSSSSTPTDDESARLEEAHPHVGSFAAALLPLTWLVLGTPAALCEDMETAESVAEAAAEATLSAVPSWFGQVVILIPLAAYGLFFYIRAKVNPRAGLLDFLFLLGVVVILANILTSIFFKVRLY